MLDFLLVLGQVPGTNFVITLGEVLFAALLIWTVILFDYEWSLAAQRRYQTRSELEFLRYVSELQLHQLGFTRVPLTDRKVAVLQADTFVRRSFAPQRPTLQFSRSSGLERSLLHPRAAFAA